VIITAKGKPDFMGSCDSVAVCFDAKDSTKAPWSLANLKKHQAEDILRMEAAGGVGFVALRVRGQGAWSLPISRVWPIWKAWHDNKEAGRRARPGTASLTLKQIEKMGVPFGRLGWIDGLLELMEIRDSAIV